MQYKIHDNHRPALLDEASLVPYSARRCQLGCSRGGALAISWPLVKCLSSGKAVVFHDRIGRKERLRARMGQKCPEITMARIVIPSIHAAEVLNSHQRRCYLAEIRDVSCSVDTCTIPELRAP
jgi:hypothetical protein